MPYPRHCPGLGRCGAGSLCCCSFVLIRGLLSRGAGSRLEDRHRRHRRHCRCLGHGRCLRSRIVLVSLAARLCLVSSVSMSFPLPLVDPCACPLQTALCVVTLKLQMALSPLPEVAVRASESRSRTGSPAVELDGSRSWVTKNIKKKRPHLLLAQAERHIGTSECVSRLLPTRCTGASASRAGPLPTMLVGRAGPAKKGTRVPGHPCSPARVWSSVDWQRFAACVPGPASKPLSEQEKAAPSAPDSKRTCEKVSQPHTNLRADQARHRQNPHHSVSDHITMASRLARTAIGELLRAPNDCRRRSCLLNWRAPRWRWRLRPRLRLRLQLSERLTRFV